jgi:hypothetical protein
MRAAVNSQLAALGEDAIRDGQLLPRGTRGDDQLASLGLKPGEPFLRPGFGLVYLRQLVLAEMTLQLLRFPIVSMYPVCPRQGRFASAHLAR